MAEPQTPDLPENQLYGEQIRRVLAATPGAADVSVMRAIKDALDPQGLFNPGRVI